MKQDETGSLLGTLMILTVVMLVLGLSLANLILGQYSITTRNVYTANAQLLSEAGVEQSILQLNQSDDFAGYETEQEFFNNETQGRGVFTTTVTNAAADNSKTIISIGRIYAHGSDKLINTRVVRVTTVGTGSEGYSVHTGPGGLILGGSANITNSDVYVNGTIRLNGAARIGTQSQPLQVKVANQVCPTGNTPGPTYPQVCTSSQPITMDWSTKIYGTVCATGQTSRGPDPAGNILGGSSGQGLLLSCVSPPISTPTYDKPAQVGAVQTTGTGSSNTYVCADWPFDRTWPADLRLTGNVNVGGSCDIVMRGNTYITGDLTIGGASKIKVDDSAGTTRPVVLVDGKITIGGSAQLVANKFGTGIHFISMKASASCNPNCTALTGNDLKNSQGVETVRVDGGTNLPGMIFQAYWGKVSIGGSGNVGAALGQTVDMSGAGTVTFGTKLSSGNRTWTITSYQQFYE